MSNSFDEVLLSDVCRVINGRAYKQDELLERGKYRVLRVGNFFSNNSWYYSNLELDEDKYCNANDLLFAWSASFGPRIWKEEKAIYHYHIWKLEPRIDSIDKMYLYYYLLQNTNSMVASTHGSTMLHITKSFMEDMQLMIPNLFTQQKIASVLSTLDDKIELNNKINAELEQMAKTLYDYWFVQFDFPNEAGKPYKSSGGKMVYDKVLKRKVPEGWEVKVFSDWIKETKAGDWGKDKEEGNYTERVYCIRGADINGVNGKGEVKAPQRFILKSNLSKALKTNDFIIEISGGSPTQSTGRIALLTNKTFGRFDTNVICSNFCKAISLKDEKYIFNFQKEWQRLYDAGVFFGYEGKTSGIKNFLFDSFVNSYKVVLPPKEIVEQYYNIAQCLVEKKQINLQQNQELIQLRDWLLPMLMNGQVKVSDNYDYGKDEHSIVIPKEMDLAAEPTIGYQKLEPFATNESLEIDPRFESWLAHQGLAARGDIDTETLREIFDAMDDEDK